MTVETNRAVRECAIALEPARAIASGISTTPPPNALLPARTAAAACVQAASSAVPSATLQVATVTGASMVKADMLALFQGWVLGSRPASGSGPDEVAWFISKRATAHISAWLNNRKLVGLHTNGAGLGVIVIARDRVEHVRNSRSAKDGLSAAGVIDLMTGLFIQGSPKYAPHPDSQKYPHQLLMFDPAFKAKDPAASGESPVAALQFVGLPVAHLRLETAYWANPGKTKALDGQALRK